MLGVLAFSVSRLNDCYDELKDFLILHQEQDIDLLLAISDNEDFLYVHFDYRSVLVDVYLLILRCRCRSLKVARES